MIEYDRDHQDGQHQARSDTPPKLEPDRVQRDVSTDPPILVVAPEKIVRKDRHKRAQREFQHDLDSRLRMRRLGLRRHKRRWLIGRIIGWALGSGELLDRPGDPLQRGLEIGQVNECQEQASDPERVDVREQRQQTEDGDRRSGRE